jgi:hypothetical protein
MVLHYFAGVGVGGGNGVYPADTEKTEARRSINKRRHPGKLKTLRGFAPAMVAVKNLM